MYDEVYFQAEEKDEKRNCSLRLEAWTGGCGCWTSQSCALIQQHEKEMWVSWLYSSFRDLSQRLLQVFGLLRCPATKAKAMFTSSWNFQECNKSSIQNCSNSTQNPETNDPHQMFPDRRPDRADRIHMAHGSPAETHGPNIVAMLWLPGRRLASEALAPNVHDGSFFTLQSVCVTISYNIQYRRSGGRLLSMKLKNTFASWQFHLRSTALRYKSTLEGAPYSTSQYLGFLLF